MKKWIIYWFIFLFFFSLMEGQTPQKQNFPNVSVRKEAVKPTSKQKDFKDMSTAQPEKWLAAKERAALKERKKPAKGANMQPVIPLKNTYSKTNAKTQERVGEKSQSINAPGLFFEGFEGLPTESYTLPANWTNISTPNGNSWTTTPWKQISAHSGSRYASILFHLSTTHNAWAITPAINLAAGKTYKISFWVLIKGDNGTYERLEVKLGTAPNSAALTTTIYDNGETEVPAWRRISYSYSPATSGNYYIGFHSFSPANVNATVFDDVKVEEMNMTAPAAPTNFTVTPDEDGALSAKLEWTNPSLTSAGNATSLTSIVIERDGTTIHTISEPTPGASLDWTDTTPTNGDHTYTVYATNSNGAGDDVSETVFVGLGPCFIPIPAIGYFEGFEEPLECWWIYNPEEDDRAWKIEEYAGYVHSGGKSLGHPYGTEQNGWAVSPLINIPAGKVVNLSFWSYNIYPGDYTPEKNAKNSVWISTGSGDPRDGDFVEVWTPETVIEDWVETKINLGAYSGKNIYIAFQYEGDSSHGWYFDDLSLSELSDIDAGVIAITSPASGLLTDSETITVTVKNFGSEALANVPVKVTIDGGAPISNTIPAIAVGGEEQCTFTPVDLSVAKSYQIRAYTELSSDGNPANDAAVITVTNIGDCVVSYFPYNQGFEEDATLSCWNDFYYDADEAEIGWATTTALSHTGSRSVFHNFSDDDEQDGWLVSPKIKIPDDGVYSLSFWSFFESPEDYGKSTLLISAGSPNPEDDDFVEIWTPAEVSLVEHWEQVNINLTDYAGKEIYIAFQYEGLFAHRWHLDDLEIKKLLNLDAGVTEIISPRSGANLTASEPIRVKVKNWGVEALSDVPVFVTIDNGTPISDTIPSIAVAEEVEYEFPGQTANLSTVKAYSVKAYTGYSGDTNSSNDTITARVTNDGNLAVMGHSASVTSCSILFVDDGKSSSNYSAEVDETQTVTFYPATAGNRVKAEFSSFASVPYLLVGMFDNPGDTLFVYNGNTADESRLMGVLTDYLTGALPAPFRSTVPDGSLTFVFKKHSGIPEAGWEAIISCFTPANHDASVVKILSPTKGGESAAQVKVSIGNYGTNPITSTGVAYSLNEGDPVRETFTGNIAVGETAEYTFTQTVDVSGYTDYTLKAYTLLTSDGDLTNDTASVSFSHKESITLYGYRIFDTSWEENMPEMGAVSFETTAPSKITDISNYKDGENFICAGAYVDGYIYAYSATNTGNPAHFIKLNAANWSVVSKVAATGTPYDMTYDYSTGTLYALSNTEADGVLLHTVNLKTGALSTGTTITGVMFLFTLAADLAGNLYGVDNDGDFVSINKTTGAATVIGNTGIEPYYPPQSMAFDYNTGRLLWAMGNMDREGRLIELDPTTGQATDLGVLGGDAQIVALHSVYTGTAIPSVTVRPFNVFPNPAKNVVYVSQVTENSVISILDLAGRTLESQAVAKSDKDVKVDLHFAPGVYFIQIESDHTKVIQKLIIK